MREVLTSPPESEFTESRLKLDGPELTVLQERANGLGNWQIASTTNQPRSSVDTLLKRIKEKTRGYLVGLGVEGIDRYDLAALALIFSVSDGKVDTSTLPREVKRPLNPAERKVFELMRAGFTQGSTASELNMSGLTLRIYFEAILSKLGVKTMYQAIAFGAREARDGREIPVEAGGSFLSDVFPEVVASDYELPIYTKREKDVLTHRAGGKEEHQIGQCLYITKDTVKKHLASAAKKTQSFMESHGLLTGNGHSRDPNYLAITLAVWKRWIKPENLPGEPIGQPTLREIEVLRLMSEGFRWKTLANILGISIDTFKKHQRSASSKLGVNHSMQAIVWYVTKRMELEETLAAAPR